MIAGGVPVRAKAPSHVEKTKSANRSSTTIGMSGNSDVRRAEVMARALIWGLCRCGRMSGTIGNTTWMPDIMMVVADWPR